MSSTRAQGRVWQIYRKRWFGFIVDDEKRSLFFRREDVDGDAFERLRVGDDVTFEPVGDEDGGLQAKHVSLIADGS